MIVEFVKFFLEIDNHLGAAINNYGIFIYLILFVIILCETGLVIAPLLPGDSLLFISGAFAGSGLMNVFVLFFILSIAAIFGDSMNYFVGNYFGKKILHEKHFVKKSYLDMTYDFYDKYGGKTIIFARFIPIVRTFAPFVAGIGSMNYSKFLLFNIIGGILWVGLFLFLGFFFGKIPFVQNNLSLIIIIIIAISFVPLVWEFIKRKR